MSTPPSTGPIEALSQHSLLKTKARWLLSDVQWLADANDAKFPDHIFTRTSAKKRTFSGVDFRYCTFDACYFRDCGFDSCDFTGCRFLNCNFHGSRFIGCKFDYAAFERTFIDNAILDECCPAYENLKLRFARSLRANFQALGDAESVNKAILVELDATGVHLTKAWTSNESYYRKKYRGLRRIKAFFAWLEFKILDLLWGNGERPGRLARSVLFFLVLLAIYDAITHGDPWSLHSYLAALLRSPATFLGTSASPPFGEFVTTTVAFLRLVAFGLFISILVRRFARR